MTFARDLYQNIRCEDYKSITRRIGTHNPLRYIYTTVKIVKDTLRISLTIDLSLTPILLFPLYQIENEWVGRPLTRYMVSQKKKGTQIAQSFYIFMRKIVQAVSHVSSQYSWYYTTEIRQSATLLCSDLLFHCSLFHN